MTGATAVLLALGPAVVTGLVGYRSAMVQAAVSMRGVEAENERLVGQHREDERQRRLTGYHDFLTLIYRLDAMMAGFAPLSQDAFEEWLDNFQRLYGAINLTASEPVRVRVAEMKAALDAIGMEACRIGGDASFERKFADSYLRGRERPIQAVAEVIEEMRKESSSS
jgi:hypothetical protein